MLAMASAPPCRVADWRRVESRWGHPFCRQAGPDLRFVRLNGRCVCQINFLYTKYAALIVRIPTIE